MNNKITDYISGNKIKATPEELEAVQPLAKELVEVYSYNKEEIKTHPQFRISLSPSDEKKSYPVDIAVFENDKLKIICECKKISSREGKEQLRKYLRMCEAKIGVWFNGKERTVLKKIETSQGVSFQELNDILPCGI
jgi:type I restriction enzyme M protein